MKSVRHGILTKVTMGIALLEYVIQREEHFRVRDTKGISRFCT